MNKKIKKPFIIMLASVFTLITVLTFFCVDHVKADNTFQILYCMTQYEYEHNVDMSDSLYSNIRQEFCTFNNFVQNGTDYKTVADSFINFVNSDNNFTSLDFNEYNLITIKQENATETSVTVFTSPRPIQTVNAYFVTYEKDNYTPFTYNIYKLVYRHDSYSMNNLAFNRYENPQTISNGTLVNDNNTYMFASWNSTFNNGRGYFAYSDGPLRFGYIGWNTSVDYAEYDRITAQQMYDIVEGGFVDYPVLQIDRRTNCPSWVDTSISADDRYINEHSRCGLKNQCYLVQGSSKELRTYFEYEPNEYLKLNRDHCYLDIRYDVQCMGNYSNFVNQFASDLQSAYGDSIHFYMSTDTTYNGGSYVAPEASSLHVSLSGMKDGFNTYNGSISNFLADKPIDTTKIVINNGNPQHVTADKYINAIMELNGYSYTSSTAFGSIIPVPIMPLNWDSSNGQNNVAVITSLKITCRVKIVDTVHPEKSSGTATYSYDFMRGSTDNQPDSIIYDDSDIVDYQDDPTYEVPTVTTTEATTQGNTSVTTQTTVITGGGSVNVTNSNVNNNNPEIHVTPSINVNPVINAPDGATTQVVQITDDDGVHSEDFQSLMDKIEEFLDFGDTFYDEYMHDILGVIPEEVWKPFAIASAFISLGCMIAFVLRRF